MGASLLALAKSKYYAHLLSVLSKPSFYHVFLLGNDQQQAL